MGCQFKTEGFFAIFQVDDSRSRGSSHDQSVVLIDESGEHVACMQVVRLLRGDQVGTRLFWVPEAELDRLVPVHLDVGRDGQFGSGSVPISSYDRDLRQVGGLVWRVGC